MTNGGGWRPGISKRGLRLAGQQNGPGAEAGGNDPLAAIRAAAALAASDDSAVLVLQNVHRFLGSPEIVQAVARQVTLGKQQRVFLVILGFPFVQLSGRVGKGLYRGRARIARPRTTS